ncbi:MAG: ferredoxin--NADP reductase [Saprospiraceae bacterium]|nr:ferredoxin--NADP reductase [Saprospiraceae bacterium]
MKFVPLKISKIQLETADTISVLFEVPENLISFFQFTPGQYLTLKAMVNGDEVRRAYSISTAPGETLGVTIKRLPGGRLSTFIHSNWKAGDVVEVSEPEGNFLLQADHDKKRKFCFIAAGSGITPILSMIKTLLEDEPMSESFLLYGSRNEENIIFKEALDNLQQKYSGQLHIVHTLSKPHKEKEQGLKGLFKKAKTSWKGETGRISKDKIDGFLSTYFTKDEKSTQYYLCGPGDLIQIAEKALEKRMVEKSNIHREFFSTPTDKTTEVKGMSSRIRVHLNGEVIDMEVSGKKPILDELIALKKNPPYSCTSGACSSCMAKTIKGEVKMESCYALDEEDVKKGFILTCQAKPVSAELEISYDV